MRILAVDDEALMLERLCRCISEAAPEAEVVSFRRAAEVLEYAKTERFDVAFLDIRMRNMDGMELARQMKGIQPNVNIVFSTGYSDYIYEAVSKVRCSGYILKPVTTEQVEAELNNLRHPVDQTKSANVYIQCFGDFEIFVNGKVLQFEVAKAKELLAYLVDRNGAICSNARAAVALWDDDGDHSAYLKKCKKNLIKTLKDAGCEELIVTGWGTIGINKEKLTCDYFEWMAGTASGINSYHGEYMKQYSWGEVTNAFLTQN